MRKKFQALDLDRLNTINLKLPRKSRGILTPRYSMEWLNAVKLSPLSFQATSDCCTDALGCKSVNAGNGKGHKQIKIDNTQSWLHCGIKITSTAQSGSNLNFSVDYCVSVGAEGYIEPPFGESKTWTFKLCVDRKDRNNPNSPLQVTQCYPTNPDNINVPTTINGQDRTLYVPAPTVWPSLNQVKVSTRAELHGNLPAPIKQTPNAEGQLNLHNC